MKIRDLIEIKEMTSFVLLNKKKGKTSFAPFDSSSNSYSFFFNVFLFSEKLQKLISLFCRFDWNMATISFPRGVPVTDYIEQSNNHLQRDGHNSDYIIIFVLNLFFLWWVPVSIHNILHRCDNICIQWTYSETYSNNFNRCRQKSWMYLTREYALR